jgi:tetratricopeptide (TPR) repeat protein
MANAPSSTLKRLVIIALEILGRQQTKFFILQRDHIQEVFAIYIRRFIIISIAVIALALMHNVNRYYDEGLSYYNQKNYDEAISKFEKVIMIIQTIQKPGIPCISWYGKGINSIYKANT